MFIDDAVMVASLASMGGLGAYFVKWLTSNMTEAVKSNTDAVNALIVVVEKCRYREGER